ncbi:unnamed protein product [Rangifer tarandus platyrhynchus]|uniref:Uncharacterized protein n=3 Tax=Rangifer tarandus platyrhynchus TaxID=3082113 RepID=A0AC59YP71_RANTA|nr:unnamed protein product [Rangifer tarandus platyrhynchus]CAI9699970.1 unnamed protein product [Rangifer tarandus platyrhynchus]
MMLEALRLAYHTDTAICPRRELGQPQGAGKRGAGSFRAAARLCPWRQVRQGGRACPEAQPPSPAPRSRPDRRVPTIGAGPPPLLPPARAHTKARQSAERKRPRPPRARPYPAAPPPAAPAADRRAPPRGSHGCCYCSSGRGRCRRSSTRRPHRPHRPHPSRFRRKTSSAAVERTRLRTTLRARAHGPAAARFTAAA